jgi:hypothetical protein
MWSTQDEDHHQRGHLMHTDHTGENEYQRHCSISNLEHINKHSRQQDKKIYLINMLDPRYERPI